MELLVYVRNYGGPKGSTFAGACVGEAPAIEELRSEDPPTSYAEFRVVAQVEDPIAELREAVRDAFARLGSEPLARPIYCGRRHSAIALRLEPGFETRHAVECALADGLGWCRPTFEPRERRVRLQPHAHRAG